MKLRVDHRFARVTLERFVAVYFSEQFNSAVAPITGMKTRRLVEEKLHDDGRRDRRVRMEPDTKLPSAMQKLADSIGKGGISYDEVSSYQPANHTVSFRIDSQANERVRMAGTICFISDGDGVRRKIEADIEVKAPLIGGVIERFIEAETVKGYAKIAVFLQQWLDEHPG